jgi:hypothetical protein
MQNKTEGRENGCTAQVSATILDTFYCRKVSEAGTWLLMADYAVTCADEGGAINSTYKIYLACAAVLCLAWSVGVPVRGGRCDCAVPRHATARYCSVSHKTFSVIAVLLRVMRDSRWDCAVP